MGIPVPKRTFMICHLCPCKDSEPAKACPKRIHVPHAMEQIRDTKFWFCVMHDRNNY